MTQTNLSPSNAQRPKRFLITGAKGFIGAWMAKTLPEGKAHGRQLPIAPDLDDSALQHDLGEAPGTPLEEGIRQTASIFERLEREGRLETKEMET
jgi:nucleoside-diphosphate-sugar epimerase